MSDKILKYESKHESQKQRWVKYGANVALTIVVVIALALLVTYLAQRYSRRIDTTALRVYSLRPQTVNIINNLKQEVKIVALYPRLEGETAKQDYFQPVADLLSEYERKGQKIHTETIDPVKEPTKVDQLIEEVSRKYGGEVKLYRDLLADFPQTLDQIKKFADDELARLGDLPLDHIKDRTLQETMILAVATVQGFPELLQRTQDRIERENKQKIPDYKGTVESVRRNLDSLSQMIERVLGDFKTLKDDEKVPEAIRQYMSEAVARFEPTKQAADQMLDRIKNLGELKLDELRQSLRQYNSILVMGEKDMRVLPFEKVWRSPDNYRTFDQDQAPRLRFAGEQQVSTALVSLTAEKKPKVAFVRPGGPPLAQAGMGETGPLADIAERLREYNFEVLEKDISGQWAMQSQMRGMPPMPEPDDEQLKDAVWVVLSYAPPFGQMGPNPLGPKLTEHLNGGGSAMVLYFPQADNLDSALKDWGIEVETDAIIVHEPIRSGGAQSADMFEEAQRVPFIFVTREYGEHPLAKPLNSLESLLVPMLPVKFTQPQGYKGSSLLPIPNSPPAWGERDVQKVMQGEAVTFDTGGVGGGDMPAPLHAGAAVEKDNGGRVVVLGSLQFAFDRFLNLPDPNLARRGLLVARFPGNAELFTNSIYWLSKMDTMIAISPAAMEVSRIAPMSDAAQRVWKVGVLIVGLPLIVLLLGGAVYLSRRD